ncbi:segregation/condensation protein A [Aerococcaceae bacterium zg-BR9]|uniref:segregation and condensation protein A n=1 Tax=Aerococcaceae bacterium zg-1292 TaxID=2774330 RepID=UPI004063143C|nr:segregation/condensation protein A [Aerococcaceae bacterium zg-BR9]MBF6977804.1 segregation/condensation protein A [Aerococcaceae bacterium zg-BR22]
MAKEILKLDLEAFHGPFDLLLHLIKELKVDINDIPMREITQQYMFYLSSMQELQLDIAGEYLVMAATLLEIKARMLLPIEPSGELDSDYEEDPREFLVQQLLLYQQFQDVATALEMNEAKRAKLYMRPAEDLSFFQQSIPLEEGAISLDQLALLMSQVLQRQKEREPKQREVEYEPLSVSDKINEIQVLIGKTNSRIAFEDLLTVGSRNEIITTFMAILEMVRKQTLVFYQASALAPIEIKRQESE